MFSSGLQSADDDNDDAHFVEIVYVVSDYESTMVSEAAECNPEPTPNKKDIGFNINITK